METTGIGLLSSSSSNNNNCECKLGTVNESTNAENASLSPLSSPSSSKFDSSFCFDNDDDDGTDFDEFSNFGNQPLVLNNDDDNDDDLSYEDDNDNDSTSCASTVVNDKPPRIVRPPTTATKEEQALFYWELCYGKGSKPSPMYMNPKANWSANRKPPTKSCLSARKTKWTEIAQSSSKRSARRQKVLLLTNEKKEKRTPTVLDSFHFEKNDDSIPNPSPLEKNQQIVQQGVTVNNLTKGFECTPNMKTPQSHNDDSCMKSVTFGDSAAVEFESSRPTVELTPLPPDKVREQFPVEEKETLSDDESTEMHHETARNGERLAMWDDDFDDYIEEWEDNDNDADVEFEDNFRESLGGKRSDNNISRRNERRSSVFFSRGGGSLVQFEPPKKSQKNDSSDMDSPDSIQNDHNDDPKSKVAIGSNKASPVSRDSMQFSSPSISSSYRLSTSESESSKVTPKADLHSSSSLLRSVHSAGGAHISSRNNDIGHDDTSQDLKPSQLDETLQKAEKGTFCQTCQTEDSQISFLCDTIIEDMMVEPTAALRDDFSRFLRERSQLYDMAFENTLSSLLRNIINNMSIDSFVDVSEEVCRLLDHNTFEVCQNDIVDVLKMSVAFLEQEIDTIKECNTAELRAQSNFSQQTFDFDDRSDLYSSLLDGAFSKWERLESQAFHTVSSCFQLVNQSNNDEEAAMINKLQTCTNGRGLEDCRRNRSLDKIQMQMKEERSNIERLLDSINKEEASMNRMRPVSSFWASRVEVERNTPLDAIDFILLKMFLTFSERLLAIDQVKVSFLHLDGHSNETQLSWQSTSEISTERRQSFSSVDSADGMIELLATTPTISRRPNESNDPICPSEVQQLPIESPASQLYKSILNDERLNNFLLKCCSQEQETGILTVTDVFQRLNLMAMDVMEVHKYYSCCVERPQKSTSLILNVTISSGETMSVGIRFTYDLAIQRTFLYAIPSEIIINQITGEPEVHIKSLMQVANLILSTGHLSNAFILNRICSAIVDTLRGQDL